MQVYRCPICGYLREGIRDFHFCQICGTPAEQFQRFTPDEPPGHWDLKNRMMISQMAETGHYALEGKGTTRQFLNMDNLLFLPVQVEKQPLLDEEPVDTQVVLGKSARKPIISQTPILNAGMSFGALSREAKMALAKASTMTGTVANTGEGGMLDEERELADKITLQYSTGRFGISDERLKQADMIEIKISQGAKPGMGGKLPGAKVTAEIARVREVPIGKTASSPARHMDIDSPGALSERIHHLRELTEGKPISLKIVGGHLEDDLHAIFSQPHIPDVLVIDGSEGGTGAAPIFTKDHVGLPLVYSLPKVADFLRSQKLGDRVTLIATGGLRHAADVAKALALGADGVYLGGALKIALGCRYIRKCHEGTCPYGIATQDPQLRTRLDVAHGAEKVSRFIRTATEEIKAICRICGKTHVKDLGRRDLIALDSELSRITGIEKA
jgi:methylamine---glutamate N-methyltransferase subunit C